MWRNSANFAAAGRQLGLDVCHEWLRSSFQRLGMFRMYLQIRSVRRIGFPFLGSFGDLIHIANHVGKKCVISESSIGINYVWYCMIYFQYILETLLLSFFTSSQCPNVSASWRLWHNPLQDLIDEQNPRCSALDFHPQWQRAGCFEGGFLDFS